jgi:hypothetical protein
MSIELLGLSDVARRVLGHLPVWTGDEEAFQQAELDAGAPVSIRSYGLADFTARLAADACTLAMDETQVQDLLEGLVEHGLAEFEDGWRMTQAGLEALTGEPEVQPANLVGGSADLDLQPAQSKSGGDA